MNMRKKGFGRKRQWILLRYGNSMTSVLSDSILLLLLLLLLSYLSPLWRMFTIIYLRQTMFLGYIVLQLFCIYSLCATRNVISPVKYVLDLYVITFHSMCAVTSMAVFCSSFILCLPGRLLWYCTILKWFQSPLLLLVSHWLSHYTCAKFLL